MEMLLLSNSTMPGKPYLDWAKGHLNEFLGRNYKTGIFIPFAAVTFSYEEYYELVKKEFLKYGVRVESLHLASDMKNAIMEREVIIVGGGNTFQLLNKLYQFDLIQIIQSKIQQDTPYIGWSAGSNIVCPSIKTTNDMPVVQPPSFKALNLVPFQINPHYTDKTITGHGGESRD